MKNDESDFSWSVLLLVTAFSSFLFSGIIKLMDGYFSNLFLMVGGSAFLLAGMNWSVRTLARLASKKRRKHRFAA